MSADLASASQPAASIARLGKGRIAATYFSFSQGYLDSHSPQSRQFLAELAAELFPEPLVQVTGSADVDVVVNRIGGKLAVNLVNTSGPHRTEPIIESISPVGPLRVVIRQRIQAGADYPRTRWPTAPLRVHRRGGSSDRPTR